MERPQSASAEANLLPIRAPATDGTTAATADTAAIFPPLISSAPVTRRPRWPTIDGPLGLSEEESLPYARRFFKFGFLLLPWLWAVNCFYFWPVLRHSLSFPTIRPYVVRSAIGFIVFTVLLSTWVLTFAIGGEKLFGSLWDKLVMYNVAEEWGLTGWM